MTDNDKAAIAAGLWKPFSQASWGEWADDHGNIAPDMHDPANLWRALNSVLKRCENGLIQLVGGFGTPRTRVFFGAEWAKPGTPTGNGECHELDFGPSFRAALVALYDTEHAAMRVTRE